MVELGVVHTTMTEHARVLAAMSEACARSARAAAAQAALSPPFMHILPNSQVSQGMSLGGGRESGLSTSKGREAIGKVHIQIAPYANGCPPHLLCAFMATSPCRH